VRRRTQELEVYWRPLDWTSTMVSKLSIRISAEFSTR